MSQLNADPIFIDGIEVEAAPTESTGRELGLNCKKFDWGVGTEKYLAAFELARGMLNRRQIAQQIKVDRRQITKWFAYPEFRRQIDLYKEEIRRELRKQGIGEIINRMNAYNNTFNKLDAIQKLRAREYRTIKAKLEQELQAKQAQLAAIMGVESPMAIERIEREIQDLENRLACIPDAALTGIMIRRIRMVGHGAAAREIVEWLLDKPLLEERRELCKLAAMDTGQWQEIGDQTTDQQAVKGYVLIDGEDWTDLV